MLRHLLHSRVRFWRRWTREERQGAVLAGVVVVLMLVIALLIHLDGGPVP